MQEAIPEETEIDLREYLEFLSDPGPPQGKALPDEDEEEVSNSDTRPLLNERDPRGINKCLKVTFEDVIAEPVSVRSGDRVWIWSHALFEVTKVWSYRIVTVLLAVPVSLIAGVLFAILSCFHIWLVSPCIQLVQLNTGCIQTVWNNSLNICVHPFFRSAGKSCSGFRVQITRE